ncbi:MAG: hypothetical protein KF773_13830 [Deltaproteobacteria bacterium]|nr:hypothetical protein [Deltaproteobacteria bacterium]
MVRRLSLAFAFVGAAACNKNETYNSAAHGFAHCTIADDRGTRCHEYRWSSPTERNELAATCIGPTSSFDQNARCPGDAVGVCKLDEVATYVYADYAELDTFDTACAENGGTYEDVGCAAARGTGWAALAAVALLARRRRRA